MAALTGGNLSADYCQTGCTVASVTLTTDSAARTVRINNLFPRNIGSGESVHVRYTLKNFINPNFVVSESVTVTLLDSSLSIFDLTSITVSTTPRQFTCSVGRLATTVSTPAEYEFTVNPNSYSLPTNINIAMTFPSIWYNSAQSGTFNTTNFACRSGVNPAIACVRAGNVVTASNLLTAATSVSFKFNMTNIVNPGSEATNN